MKKKIKIVLYCLILLFIVYEAYYYISFKSNSYIAIVGSETSRYKSDFVLMINDENIDTLNVNIPISFSESHNLSFGKNIIRLRSLDSTKNYEASVYFYGLFTWNILEVTSKEFIFNTHYSVPPIE